MADIRIRQRPIESAAKSIVRSEEDAAHVRAMGQEADHARGYARTQFQAADRQAGTKTRQDAPLPPSPPPVGGALDDPNLKIEVGPDGEVIRSRR